MSSQLERTQPEPHEEEQLPHTHVGPAAEIARLKRRLAASQEEVRELTHGKAKKPPYVDLLLSGQLSYKLSVGQLLP